MTDDRRPITTGSASEFIDSVVNTMSVLGTDSIGVMMTNTSGVILHLQITLVEPPVHPTTH